MAQRKAEPGHITLGYCALSFLQSNTSIFFIIDFRSSGKYWVDVLYLGNDGNRVDLNQIKSSTVIDESKKKELIRVLESATEDSNPVLMIATLK